MGALGMDRAGEGVHRNRGVDVRVRRCQVSPYVGEGAVHLTADDPRPDPSADSEANDVPSGSPNTQGTAVNAGRDQREGRAGPDAPTEECELERADMDEWDSATRSTLGTCP